MVNDQLFRFRLAAIAIAFLFFLTLQPIKYGLAEPMQQEIGTTTRSPAEKTSSVNEIDEKHKEIVIPINNYIAGTSYGYADKLRNAFVPGARMFLDHDQKPLFILTIEQYAGGVEKRTKTPGKFNGRITRILSIDRFEGIATAKLEVIIPRLKKRFIDYLLLKKLKDGWKIISKTAGSEPFSGTKGNVLFVLSGATVDGNRSLSVGNDFSEISNAYHHYQNAGFQVDFISPKGGPVSLENVIPSDKIQLELLYNPDFMFALKNTKTPEQVRQNRYDIVHFSGGRASLVDLAYQPEILKIAEKAYSQKNGIIACSGFGIAAVLKLKDPLGQPLVKGKNVSCISNSAQKYQTLHSAIPFNFEKELKNNEAQIVNLKTAKSMVSISNRMITSSEVDSSGQVAVEALKLFRSMHRTENPK